MDFNVRDRHLKKKSHSEQSLHLSTDTFGDIRSLIRQSSHIINDSEIESGPSIDVMADNESQLVDFDDYVHLIDEKEKQQNTTTKNKPILEVNHLNWTKVLSPHSNILPKLTPSRATASALPTAFTSSDMKKTHGNQRSNKEENALMQNVPKKEKKTENLTVSLANDAPLDLRLQLMYGPSHLRNYDKMINAISRSPQLLKEVPSLAFDHSNPIGYHNKIEENKKIDMNVVSIQDKTENYAGEDQKSSSPSLKSTFQFQDTSPTNKTNAQQRNRLSSPNNHLQSHATDAYFPSKEVRLPTPATIGISTRPPTSGYANPTFFTPSRLTVRTTNSLATLRPTTATTTTFNNQHTEKQDIKEDDENNFNSIFIPYSRPNTSPICNDDLGNCGMNNFGDEDINPSLDISFKAVEDNELKIQESDKRKLVKLETEHDNAMNDFQDCLHPLFSLPVKFKHENNNLTTKSKMHTAQDLSPSKLMLYEAPAHVGVEKTDDQTFNENNDEVQDDLNLNFSKVFHPGMLFSEEIGNVILRARTAQLAKLSRLEKQAANGFLHSLLNGDAQQQLKAQVRRRNRLQLGIFDENDDDYEDDVEDEDLKVKFGINEKKKNKTDITSYLNRSSCNQNDGQNSSTTFGTEVQEWLDDLMSQQQSGVNSSSLNSSPDTLKTIQKEVERAKALEQLIQHGLVKFDQAEAKKYRMKYLKQKSKRVSDINGSLNPETVMSLIRTAYPTIPRLPSGLPDLEAEAKIVEELQKSGVLDSFEKMRIALLERSFTSNYQGSDKVKQIAKTIYERSIEDAGVNLEITECDVELLKRLETERGLQYEVSKGGPFSRSSLGSFSALDGVIEKYLRPSDLLREVHANVQTVKQTSSYLLEPTHLMKNKEFHELEKLKSVEYNDNIQKVRASTRVAVCKNSDFPLDAVPVVEISQEWQKAKHVSKQLCNPEIVNSEIEISSRTYKKVKEESENREPNISQILLKQRRKRNKSNVNQIESTKHDLRSKIKMSRSSSLRCFEDEGFNLSRSASKLAHILEQAKSEQESALRSLRNSKSVENLKTATILHTSREIQLSNHVQQAVDALKFAKNDVGNSVTMPDSYSITTPIVTTYLPVNAGSSFTGAELASGQNRTYATLQKSQSEAQFKFSTPIRDTSYEQRNIQLSDGKVVPLPPSTSKKVLLVAPSFLNASRLGDLLLEENKQDSNGSGVVVPGASQKSDQSSNLFFVKSMDKGMKEDQIEVIQALNDKNIDLKIFGEQIAEKLTKNTFEVNQRVNSRPRGMTSSSALPVLSRRNSISSLYNGNFDGRKSGNPLHPLAFQQIIGIQDKKILALQREIEGHQTRRKNVKLRDCSNIDIESNTQRFNEWRRNSDKQKKKKNNDIIAVCGNKDGGK